MSENLPEENEAEFRVMTQNMYNHGGVINVLDCLITMLETAAVILRKLKDIEKRKQ